MLLLATEEAQRAFLIYVKRIYDLQEPEGGKRFLVDRLWPRGIKKEDPRISAWHRDVAPSDELRRWFGHDPERWEEFKRRYFAELEKNPQSWQPPLEAARKGDVTLLYSAKDTEQNNAVALKEFLDTKLNKASQMAIPDEAKQ